MSIVKIPTTKAPWPPRRQNDKLYRYPKAYPVGKETGESFGTIAKKHGLEAADLVKYNFQTTNSNEINWYLANYVGCPTPKPGAKYYTFAGAVADPNKKDSGVIFIPMFGEQASDYVNRLGEVVVANYNKSTRKEPGGACFATCYARVKEASKEVGSVVVPSLDPSNTFGRLWGSYILPKKAWLDLPEEYRAKGAPGAMAWAGLGTLVDSDAIWFGKLKPGAVIQVWKIASDFARVRDGEKPAGTGHSFLFMNYIYSGPNITAIAMADQGNQNREPLGKGAWAYWVGANLTSQSATTK